MRLPITGRTSKRDGWDGAAVTATLLPYLFFAVTVLLMAVLMTRGRYLYGSQIDWQIQHASLADHLRRMFYETGDFIPSFDVQLGGGQNIWYLAYYGVLSPVVLLSYLFPRVTMEHWLTGASLVSVIVSIMLLYRWLKGKTTGKTAFLGALLFEFAVPIMYHSHRQVVFIAYMPFLILALFGADRYLRKGGVLLMMVSECLMILTSYYFSAAGTVAIGLYLVVEYVRQREAGERCLRKRPVAAQEAHKRSGGRGAQEPVRAADTEKTESGADGAAGAAGDLVRTAGGGILALGCGIAAAGILLLPVLQVLRSGRVDNAVSVTAADLFVPDFLNAGAFYGSSSMGLTSIFAVAVIAGLISGQRHRQLMCGALALLCSENVFVWLLNGRLYIDGKVLIPFLPLAVLAMAQLLDDLCARSARMELLAAASAVFGAAAFFLADSGWIRIVFVLDLSITLMILAFYAAGRLAEGCLSAVVLTAALVSMSYSMSDGLISIYDRDDDALAARAALYEQVAQQDWSLYRTGDLYARSKTVDTLPTPRFYSASTYLSLSNPYYIRFGSSLFAEQTSRNGMVRNQMNGLLYNLFMGNKYLTSARQPAAGYVNMRSEGGIKLWKNALAYPLAYCTSATMSQADYDELPPAERAMALMTRAVSEQAETSRPWKVKTQELDTSDFYRFHENLDFGFQAEALSETEYRLTVPTKTTMTLTLPEKVKSGLVLVSMYVDTEQPVMRSDEEQDISKADDITIRVNGITNKLSDPGWRYDNKNHLFQYAVSSDRSISKLKITFGTGMYTVSDFTSASADMDAIRTFRRSLDEFHADRSADGIEADGTADGTKANYSTVGTVDGAEEDRTTGSTVDGAEADRTMNETTDGIESDDTVNRTEAYPSDVSKNVILNGRINVRQDGWFVCTIPYDRNFCFYVDGKKQEYYLTDEAFMGFPLEEGEHRIRAEYHNPAEAAGRGVSAGGVTAAAALTAWSLVRRRRK